MSGYVESSDVSSFVELGQACPSAHKICDGARSAVPAPLIGRKES